MEQSCINRVLQRLFGKVPARISLGALAFLGFVVMTSVRINIAVAIVGMVRQNASSALTAQAQCLGGNETRWTDGRAKEGDSNRTIFPTEEQVEQGEEEEDQGDMLDWDEVTQGLVIASFFYGYTFTQIIGGRLAEKYGTRITFGICGLTSGFFTLLSPVAARSHYGALIAVRVLMGFFQGPMWPSMHALVPRWIPPLERSRFIASVYFASNLSMMVTMATTGVIVAYLGWAAAFYIPGTLCIVWASFWLLLVSDDPSQHPRISSEEREHIESTVRKAGSSRTRPQKVPWRDVFTSLPFWAIIIPDIGNVFGLSVYSSHLPTYMKNVLGFSIKENGLLSSLPFLCRYTGANTFGALCDRLLASKRISLLMCRRVFSAIALFFPAIFCIATAYSGCSATLTVIFLCLANFTNGAIGSSILVNYTDISPNFSGTLFGIGNTFCSFMMFLAPVCVGAIIQGQQTMSQWRKVFWACVPLYALTEVFYLLTSSTDVQPWNSAGEEEEEEKAKEGKEDGNCTTTITPLMVEEATKELNNKE
ncbi:sialin-like isoform X2 [Eriocheir sinensis]|uniref:sialin-like isoform X2 n=1 Tax=Eriocheir sinensis TaxID=95602 RepID=UPI0021C597A8|nr:sialin-like isoform X2 [Eriocheir sinensis]